MITEIERRTIKKVGWRLIPLMLLCYLVNYLDRINVGFAALGMNRDLGISATVFGWGAGLFFISYFIFEVPSNIALHRVGARRWIARILITWGIVSAGFAFVQGPISFVILRFVLGITEAGFFPGMILYVGYWFPPEYRGKLTALFMTAIPLSALVGSPISGALLQIGNFWTLSSWQWLFILEGAPAMILGVVVWFCLTDRPSDARWLTGEERAWLISRLEAENKQKHLSSLGAAIKSPEVILMAIIHMGFAAGSYGIGLWLPLILHGYRLEPLQVGLMSAVPYIFAVLGMVIWGSISDRRGNRTTHVALGCLLGAIGLGWAVAAPSLVGAIAGISLSTLGVVAARPIFWTIPGSFLTGVAAAGGIAFINALGNLGGFVGTYAVGFLKDRTGTYAAGMLALVVPLITSVVAALILARRLKNKGISNRSTSTAKTIN